MVNGFLGHIDKEAGLPKEPTEYTANIMVSGCSVGGDLHDSNAPT